MSIDLNKEWTFKDSNVANDFDKHVREQLPWYDLVNNIIRHFALHYIPKNGLIYDIGASTGNVGRVVEPIVKSRGAEFIAIEESSEMCEKYNSIGKVINEDALKFEYDNYDFGVCMLVIMFMPVSDREDFVRELYRNLKKGGCILIFDKVMPEKEYLGLVNHRLSLAMKVSSGVSYEEIVKKELSLSGVQIPLERLFIKTVIPSASIVFKFGEFIGYAITKESY